ncbi:DNA primase [Jonesia denitrificans]|uniref:DNA primase n=1 Tax=Jonesia denitrificans (strain ATCC 14870 / DSM 20603 / BCRC 15368 / CIP 55.134 / JCM 11481 / NBRC 15587 / NCTC 10816 / Prevot 55134) TaxID=471856 RepID=C7R500_JONDD|nr:DNA primase [Jonesia denitrificans]ACV09170.1 DNA primase [Jonesia denitrificans DSM 20603]ASE09554.1 DNA primase [Jonesia denitrificans]QXB44097.1 DNA primase [Jonesia denitrificans]SQH21398.1 DNA primase [Jonesia denitrificans]
MAGLIKRDDVDAVRERAKIDDIVGEHVTLKPAGVGSMKGLCPFHDEKSPSFHVRPHVGRYHCFGCGEGGDVISFIQKVDGLTFTEAVEYLAGRVGLTLRYEEGSERRGEEPSRRARLLAAHRIAAAYYQEQLMSSEAATARQFLADRSFSRDDAAHFGVGYAPKGWDHLLTVLRSKGFTTEEIQGTGLMSSGQRGMYDRFRGRLMWPIRDVTGEVIGFGARRLYDDDQGPKYLNTPETSLYRKSQVLYGIDLAKRDIAKEKRVVVVEGYTDVMAAHLSGVTTAVATCGTAFGVDHVKFVRRLLGDTHAGGGVRLASGGSMGGEIIFTFDGDAAGRKAAMRAFDEEQRFLAQTFVAVQPDGLDPCELRQQRGPAAVADLVNRRVPLFEFVLRTTLEAFPLHTAEGRVGALRQCAPVVASIRDAALRPEYSRVLAGWLGMDLDVVRQAVQRAGRSSRSSGGEPSDAQTTEALDGAPAPHASDPVARLERQTLEVMLQQPHEVPGAVFDALPAQAFAVPAWRAVFDAIRAAGGLTAAASLSAVEWVEAVLEAAADPVRVLVNELSVAPLPEDRPEAMPLYVQGIVRAFIDMGMTRQIGDVKSRLQRMDYASDPEAYQEVYTLLVDLEAQRRQLRDTE